MATQSSIAQPPLPLAGRVAIVTGSSRGIGRAIAIHLAELGARIVINYTSKAADAERVASEINDFPVREEITGKGPRAIVVQANVSEPSQVKSMFDAAERAFEAPVHILVNSAGILDPKYPTIADTSVEDFDRTFSVNTKGAFLCSKEAANRLKQGGGGRIILVTSSTTRSLRQGFGAYAASKAAVETMVKILAKELKGTGITANCVAPGPIATEMFFHWNHFMFYIIQFKITHHSNNLWDKRRLLKYNYRIKKWLRICQVQQTRPKSLKTISLKHLKSLKKYHQCVTNNQRMLLYP